MRLSRISVEPIIYTALFLLALVIRMGGIGQLPLGNPEANLALQALALSQGEATQISPQPAYLALTTALMFLFDGEDWTARFWPALAGSLLVLLPVLYRKWLGTLAAWFVAFFLALDPSLLAASLQANGLVLSVFFTLLSLGLFMNGRVALAGIAGGMALLGGPAVWPGVLGLGLAVMLTSRRPAALPGETDHSGQELFPAIKFGPGDWGRFVRYTLATIFFAGTLFFMFPRGLSAMAASLPAYLGGWFQPSGVPVLLLILALALYEFMLLFLGIWGGIGGLLQKAPFDRFLLVWWAISLGIVLIYPGRQVIDLAWVMIPMAGLAGRQLSKMTEIQKSDRLPVIGQSLLAALILGFLSLSLISMLNNLQSINVQEYWARLMGAVFMFVASTWLIGWGWSKKVAINGAVWGLFTILLLYSISVSWDSANLSSSYSREFWTSGFQLPEEHLLIESVNNLSEWGTAVSGGPDLVVVDIQSPALRWALRDYARVEYVNQLPIESSPAMLITADQPELALAATYRGQDFVLNQVTDWKLFKGAEWVRWLAFRVVPDMNVQRDRVILWARTDLFPGDEIQLSPNQGEVEDLPGPE